MSSGPMYIRYPDGEIKMGTYHGTSGVYGHTCYSRGEYEFGKERDYDEKDPLPLEDVSVFVFYGCDWTIETKASRDFLHIPIKMTPWSGDGFEYLVEKVMGLPSWYPEVEALWKERESK